jgi:hypothetical protein
MKTILAIAGAAGLLALAACNDTSGNKAAENKADAIEANAANTADAITSNASNTADAITSNASNTADAIRDNASAGNSSGH